jgi:hypothetical protein
MSVCAGILLRRMAGDGELSRVTHVIIDEVQPVGWPLVLLLLAS